jgi:hypothetical protein
MGLSCTVIMEAGGTQGTAIVLGEHCGHESTVQPYPPNPTTFTSAGHQLVAAVREMAYNKRRIA